MHQRVLAERNEAAQNSILESATILGERYQIAPEITEGLTATYREPAVQEMLRREAVADLLEAITKQEADSEDAATGHYSQPVNETDDEPVVDQGPADLGPSDESSETETFPDGFPSADLLASAGINSIMELRSKSREDLIALPGIGEKKADAILAALEDLG